MDALKAGIRNYMLYPGESYDERLLKLQTLEAAARELIANGVSEQDVRDLWMHEWTSRIFLVPKQAIAHARRVLEGK